MKQTHDEHEFKIQSVKLALKIGQSKDNHELNLSENTIYDWILNFGMGTR